MWPFGSRDVNKRAIFVVPQQQDGLNQLRRCVLGVYQRYVDQGSPEGRETLSRSYAICTSQLQKYGYLEPGTHVPTAKGFMRSIEKASDPVHQDRMQEYERVLARARKPKRSSGIAPNLERSSGLPPDLEALRIEAVRRGADRQSARKSRMRGATARSSSLPLVSDLGSANHIGAGKIWTTAIALQRAAVQVFSCDTAFGDCELDKPSRGHCLLASMLFQDLVGGKIMSGSVGGIPHYWNRTGGFDVDLTAGQFGDQGLVISSDKLYGQSRPFSRKPGKLLEAIASNNEANAMYLVFSERARAQAASKGYGKLLEV